MASYEAQKVFNCDWCFNNSKCPYKQQMNETFESEKNIVGSVEGPEFATIFLNVYCAKYNNFWEPIEGDKGIPWGR